MFRFVLVLFLIAYASSTIDKQKILQELRADESFIAARNTCLKSLSMDENTKLKTLEDDELSDNILCLIKCIQEKQGYLDSDGHLVMDKSGDLPIFKQMNEAETTIAMDCIKKIEKIVACQDLMKVKECFKHVE